MKKFLPVSAVVIALVAGGCSKEDMGTVVGGAAGALAGAQFGKGTGQLAMMAGGTLLGAFLGNSVGKSLDKADSMYAQRTATNALESSPSGHASTWKNPDSGHSGTIIPARATQDPTTGQYCREFQQTVNVGGQEQKAYGTACRQPDGSWKIIQ